MTSENASESVPDSGRDINAAMWLYREDWVSMSLLNRDSLLALWEALVAWMADGEYSVPSDRAVARVFNTIAERHGEKVAEYREKKRKAREAALIRHGRNGEHDDSTMRPHSDRNADAQRPHSDRNADGLLTKTKTKTELNKNDNENETGGAGGTPSASISDSGFNSDSASPSGADVIDAELERITPEELIRRTADAIGDGKPSRKRWRQFIEAHGKRAFRDVGKGVRDELRREKRIDNRGAYLNAMLDAYEREHAGEVGGDALKAILAMTK